MAQRNAPPRGFFAGGAGRVVPLKSPSRSVVPQSPGTRMKELIARPDAKSLVRHTPPQDLFLLIKQVGLGDATEVLSLASLDQVQRMIDMDVWTKDELRLDDYGEWLKVMTELNFEDLSPLLQELDPEQLILFLKDHITVYLREDDAPEPETLELESKNIVATSDQTFLLEFMPDDDWHDFILTFIDRVYAVSLKTAHWLLFSVMTEGPSHLEEQALRLKNGRMEEAGFPDTFEAMALFQPLSGGQLHPATRIVPERPSAGPLREVPLPMERFRPADGSLLTQALEQLARTSPEDDFSHDLLRLSNKVVAAQARNPGELDDLREALEQTHAYVNLGLELLVTGEAELPPPGSLLALLSHSPRALTPDLDVDAAASALKSVHVEWLFRRGFTAALSLQKQARPVHTRLLHAWKRPLEVQADEPWRHWLEGARRPHPVRWEGTRPTPTGPVLAFGPFAHREQLHEAARWIRELDVVRRFVFEWLAPEQTEVRTLRRSLAEMNTDLTPMSIFLTAMARRTLGGVFSPEPLSPAELNTFVGEAFEAEAPLGRPHPLKAQVWQAMTSLLDAWQTSSAPDIPVSQEELALEREVLSRYLNRAKDLLEERYGLLGPGGGTDPQRLAGPLLVNLR